VTAAVPQRDIRATLDGHPKAIRRTSETDLWHIGGIPADIAWQSGGLCGDRSPTRSGVIADTGWLRSRLSSSPNPVIVRLRHNQVDHGWEHPEQATRIGKRNRVATRRRLREAAAKKRRCGARVEGGIDKGRRLVWAGSEGRVKQASRSAAKDSCPLRDVETLPLTPLFDIHARTAGSVCSHLRTSKREIPVTVSRMSPVVIGKLMPQSVFVNVCSSYTRQLRFGVIPWRMIKPHRPSAAREAVPEHCTARCAPSISCSQAALQIDCARSPMGLAPNTSRAGNSLLGIEPGEGQKPVQHKMKNFAQAKLSAEFRGYRGQHSTTPDFNYPIFPMLLSLRDSERSNAT